MVYTQEKAKELVVKAGKELVQSGLIARTWGNVSARISDTQFIITPSGRPYKTLTPEELVVVNIDDLEYEGDIKPSSEKGVHAVAYKLRPDVDFVIHTHQLKASVVSTTGLDIDTVPDKYKSLVGNCVPCSDYGMPSTKKLMNCVENSIREYPDSKAFIMKHHGALCLGKDYDEAFNVAKSLEDISEQFIQNNYLSKCKLQTFDADAMREFYLKLEDRSFKLPTSIKDLGKSERNGKNFVLTMRDGKTYNIDVESGVSDDGLVPKIARIHSEIYKSTNATCIDQLIHPDVLTISVVNKSMRPLLDDFAQLIGPLIECGEWNEFERKDSSKSIAKKLFARNAVIVKDCGALCISTSQSDLEAIKMVMQKGCESQIGARLFGVKKTINFTESLLMRTIYIKKYSKQAQNQ